LEIQFFGGVRSVTGTMHLLHVNGEKILLDCGLFQGRRDEAFERNRHFPFAAGGIDTMILSHAHIDHSGNIPQLVKSGFSGDIFCTHATRDLCSIMLQDSGHIQEKDAEFVNKKRFRRGLLPLEPLYTARDAEKSLNNFVSIGYNRPLLIAEGVWLTFLDAGHILGSAISALDIEEDAHRFRLVFSGDLGRPGMPILRDPAQLDRGDILFIESTYGGRLHDDYTQVETKLTDVINQTIQRGGKIIVPAFSVGRTQELVYTLHKLELAKKIPSIPIFVDSPLSVNATQIFRAHPECYDEEASHFSQSMDPFGFHHLQYISDTEDSKKLNTFEKPCMIISASGMCEAGRILHHLANNIQNPRNTILIIGFMAENTLGKRIVEREPAVRIFGEEYDLKAQVVRLNAFSAHADHNELLQWIGHFDRQQLQHIFVLHGEMTQSEALAEGIGSLGFSGVRIPEIGEQVTIGK